MTKRSFFQRYDRWICVTALLLTPVLLHQAYQVMQSSNNNVVDWLPKSFQQTTDLYWFNERFGIDAIMVISWPGCTLNDQRLDLLEQRMLALQGPGKNGSPKPLFRRVFTGRSTLRQLSEPPLDMPRETAIQRMQGWLVGADGLSTCVVGFLSHEGWWDRHATIGAVAAIAREIGVDRQSLRLGGPAVDSVAIDQVSQQWLAPLGLASGLLGIVLAWFCLRQVRLVAPVFLYAAFLWIASLAAVELFGSSMDAVMTVMPALVYVLAVSSAIHMTGYYRRVLREQPGRCAATAAVKMGWAPCTAAAMTTALGLGSLMVSQVVPIRKFGFYAALGTLLALGFLFLLWPALLTWFGPRSGNRSPNDRSGSGADRTGLRDAEASAADANCRARVPWWQGWLDCAVSQWLVILLLVAVSMVVLAAGIVRLRASVGLRDLFSLRSQVLRDYAWLEQNIGPLIPVEVVLRFPQPDSSDPREMLDRMLLVERIRRQIHEMPAVGGTIAASSFVPDVPSGRTVRSVGRRAVIARYLVENRQQLANLGFLHEDHTRPDGTLAEAVTEEQWRISGRIEALSNLDYASLLAEFTEAVRQMLDQDEAARRLGVTENISGGVFLVAMAQQRLLWDLAESFALAFVMISIAMMVLTRSLSIGMLAMIPNVFPVLLILGLMGWGGMPVDVGTMMTACVALGIAVDDTSHFLTWYRRAMAEGHDHRSALREAYRHCATPMLQTSLICGLGMLVFALSPFMPAARFAWLMFALLNAALAADLLILPALLASPLGRLLVSRVNRASADPDAEARGGILHH
ncbi:MAG: MMPL family transporter [Pirellulaceae bacterium]|nr:MMPL family transporter [Pirellulaceae bacterium]